MRSLCFGHTRQVVETFARKLKGEEIFQRSGNVPWPCPSPSGQDFIIEFYEEETGENKRNGTRYFQAQFCNKRINSRLVHLLDSFFVRRMSFDFGYCQIIVVIQ